MTSKITFGLVACTGAGVEGFRLTKMKKKDSVSTNNGMFAEVLHSTFMTHKEVVKECELELFHVEHNQSQIEKQKELLSTVMHDHFKNNPLRFSSLYGCRFFYNKEPETMTEEQLLGVVNHWIKHWIKQKPQEEIQIGRVSFRRILRELVEEEIRGLIETVRTVEEDWKSQRTPGLERSWQDDELIGKEENRRLFVASQALNLCEQGANNSEDKKMWKRMKSKYEAARKKATRRQCIRQLKQIWPIIFILILAVILMIYKLF